MPTERPLIHAPTAIDHALDQLVDWVTDRCASGSAYRHGELIQVGWAAFRVDCSGPSPRITAPLPGVQPMQFVEDCSDALNVDARQRFLLESFDVQALTCNCTQAALAVKDLAFCDEWFLDRVGEQDGFQSGWVVSASDSELDTQDPDALELVSLWELTCRNPEIAPFLLLPIGWQVSFERRPHVMHELVEVEPRPGSFFAARYGA